MPRTPEEIIAQALICEACEENLTCPQAYMEGGCNNELLSSEELSE